MRSNKILCGLLLVLIGTGCMAAPETEQVDDTRTSTEFGDTPAARAAAAFIDVTRAGDDTRTRDFVHTQLSPELQSEFPMEEHLQQVKFFRADLEKRTIAGVELDGPHAIALMLASPKDRLRLRLTVDPQPPHRITGINIRQAGPEITARTLEEFDRELARLAQSDEFSGVVLISSGGDIRFHRAYGSADRSTGRPVEPETRFDIGSLTKLFTSTAILRLAQEGRLGLDDPIGKYLDGFAPQIAEQVTIRHLLQHRSGFDDYFSQPEFRADPQRFDEPAAYLPLARRQELAFKPGTEERYSNMGFVLLGAILEEVTDRGYHQAVGDIVYRPAGMRSAGPSGGPIAARRYRREDGRFISVDSLYPSIGSPAGGGFAAATDLKRFVDALLGGMLLDEHHIALLLNGFEAPADGRGLPERFAFEGGARGLSAVLIARPENRDVVVVLANMSPPTATAIAEEAEKLLQRGAGTQAR